MKHQLPIILLLSSALYFSCNNVQKEHDDQASIRPKITTIAFGSCSHQEDEDQFWDDIADQNPAFFIQLGDNIYGDTPVMRIMKAKYKQQKSRGSYQRLLKTTTVIGTWDDHDYGVDDGGKNYAKKDSSKILFMDFMDIPDNSPMRDHPGVYNSYTFNDHNKKIKVLMLDTRYFRDTLDTDLTGKMRYMPNETGDILGEQQWEWLANQLDTTTADVNIIGSSIQVIAEEQGYEKWANFPKSRQRLFDLIQKTKAANALIISGDRHIAELSKVTIDDLPYPLYDFTSSGFTHTWNEAWEEPNQHRVGEMVIAKNYGLIKIDWESNEMAFLVKGKNDQTLFLHSNTMQKP